MNGLRAAISIGLGLVALAGQAGAQTWFSLGRNIPNAELVDSDGKAWRFEDLMRARPVLLGFFYTGCYSVCPLETARMQAVQEELARRDDSARPLLLSISLQPWADTPETIKNFAAQFGIAPGFESGWLMLTGRPEQLAGIWRAFDQEGGPQAAEHGGELWVFRPDRNNWSKLRPTARPDEIIRALEVGR